MRIYASLGLNELIDSDTLQSCNLQVGSSEPCIVEDLWKVC